MSKQKRIYALLGASRSGTSAIARSMPALGISLGNALLAGDERNPSGFFEDKDVLYQINRKVSAHLNQPLVTIDRWQSNCYQQDIHLNALFNHALKVLEKRFADTDDWGFKDPRTVTILPFWQDVMRAAGLDDRYIIVIRNPLAVASSSKKVFNIDQEMGLILWLTHTIPAIIGTMQKKRVIVSYEAMLLQPVATCEKMHAQLAIPTALNQRAIEEYAHGFLQLKMRHYSQDHRELQANPLLKVAPLCLRAYNLLNQVATEALNIESPAFLSEWEVIVKEFYSVLPLYDYANSLRFKHLEAQRELRHIKRSLSWKLTSPLRMIKR